MCLWGLAGGYRGDNAWTILNNLQSLSAQEKPDGIMDLLAGIGYPPQVLTDMGVENMYLARQCGGGGGASQH